MSSTLTRILRWPLWSWRNLTVTGAALLALLAVLGRATDGEPSSSALSSPQPSTTTTPTTTGTPPPAAPSLRTSAVPPSTMPVSVAPGSATDVATAFVTAWAAGAKDGDSWRAAMSRWASPDLLRSLEGTNPDQVPADHVVGEASLANASGKAAAVMVPTDGGLVAVSLVKAGAGWRVSSIAPADAPPAAETPSLSRTTPGS